MCYIGSLYLSNGTTSRNHGTMYLITAILCIGEAAATSSNYADSQEEKESEQNSGPQRNDYTTHSLRTEILIAMTATMLLIVMIDRTVCRLTRPTDKPDAQNDGAERRTNNLSQRPECEIDIPDYNDKAACELALYGTTNQPVFRRLHIPRCSTHRGCLRHDEDHLMTGSIQMKQYPWVNTYNRILQEFEEMPWTVDIYQPIFILGTWYKWQWQNQLGFVDAYIYDEDDYVYGVDDLYKPSCDFRKLQNGCWRACGGMKGWRDQPDLVNYAYTHLALTLQSMIAAQQPPQRHMAREETRKALLFVLRKQATIRHGSELIDAYIEHTQMDYEGTYGDHTFLGSRKSDDMQESASDPHNLYLLPIDTDGNPVKRSEPMNMEPTFCYLQGSEDYTRTGQSFEDWKEFPVREDGEEYGEPVNYGLYDVEDSEGFKHQDYDGKGEDRRGVVEWRDERRAREAEVAKDPSHEEVTEEAKDIKEYWADMKSRTNSRHRTRSRSKTPIRGLHRGVLG